MPPTATKRLLHTTTHRLHYDDDPEYQESPGYAILSHRWLKKEITFDTIKEAWIRLSREGAESLEIQKVKGGCAKAREHNLKWLWIDSICINRANEVENRTAINSMFKWYRQAAICLAYLSDVLAPPAVSGLSKLDRSLFQREDHAGMDSEWFERGWTLQELLAPRYVEFFDKDWKYLGNKAELAETLAIITRINVVYLTDSKDSRKASTATKMSWMAGRVTTKAEDIAYSMVGLFSITNMDPNYAEGMRAFTRLEEEIIRKPYFDESIFAWKAPASGLPRTDHPAGNWAPDEWGLLAPSPECFRASGDIVLDDSGQPRPLGRLHLQREGLTCPLPMRDWISLRARMFFWSFIWIPILGCLIPQSTFAYAAYQKREFALTLNCLRPNATGALKPVQVHLRRASRGKGQEHLVFRRHRCYDLSLAPKRRHIRHAQANFHPSLSITVLQPEPDEE